MTERDSSLDDSFAKLLGRQPSDAERQQLYRVRDALELKNNDAVSIYESSDLKTKYAYVFKKFEKNINKIGIIVIS